MNSVGTIDLKKLPTVRPSKTYRILYRAQLNLTNGAECIGYIGGRFKGDIVFDNYRLTIRGTKRISSDLRRHIPLEWIVSAREI